MENLTMMNNCSKTEMNEFETKRKKKEKKLEKLVEKWGSIDVCEQNLFTTYKKDKQKAYLIAGSLENEEKYLHTLSEEEIKQFMCSPENIIKIVYYSMLNRVLSTEVFSEVPVFENNENIDYVDMEYKKNNEVGKSDIVELSVKSKLFDIKCRPNNVYYNHADYISELQKLPDLTKKELKKMSCLTIGQKLAKEVDYFMFTFAKKVSKSNIFEGDMDNIPKTLNDASRELYNLNKRGTINKVIVSSFILNLMKEYNSIWIEDTTVNRVGSYHAGKFYDTDVYVMPNGVSGIEELEMLCVYKENDYKSLDLNIVRGNAIEFGLTENQEFGSFYDVQVINKNAIKLIKF